jgi:hypothetical protein
MGWRQYRALNPIETVCAMMIVHESLVGEDERLMKVGGG